MNTRCTGFTRLIAGDTLGFGKERDGAFYLAQAALTLVQLADHRDQLNVAMLMQPTGVFPPLKSPPVADPMNRTRIDVFLTTRSCTKACVRA